MKLKLHSAIFYLLLTITPLIHAVEPLPSKLVDWDFTSAKGQYLLKDNLEKQRKKKDASNTLNLLSHFTTQKTTTYCGVASLVMVLNSSNLPKPEDPLHEPYHYFTQDNFFNEKVKAIIPAEGENGVEKNGITLDELARIANEGFNLNAKAFHADYFYSADKSEPLKKFRKKLRYAISNNQFVIVNFLRNEISKDMGFGHHSPLAAYDKDSDRFLLLDVARYKYPSYWVETKDLWKAINTKDDTSKLMRGILVMTNDKQASFTEELEEEFQE